MTGGDIPPPPDGTTERRQDQLRKLLLTSSGLDSIPQPAPVIDGLLYTDSLTWLTGKRGTAKTFVVIDMGACVAAGLDWQGLPVKQGPVLYVAAEGVPGIRKRVRAWEDRARQVMPVTFLPVAVRLPADAQAVAEIARELGAILIIIDTQSRVTVGMDENSSRDMGLFVQSLEVIREVTHACVLVIHHEARNSDTPRGHSAMDGAATALLRVEKDGPLITLHNPKQKDTQQSEQVRLLLATHLDSAVVTPIGNSNDHFRTDSETTVRKALLELVGVQGGASSSALLKACELSSSTFYYALNALVRKGEVVNQGSAKRTFYVLAGDSLPGL